MPEDHVSRSELLSVGALLAFLAVFLAAMVWQFDGMAGGLDRKLRDLAGEIEIARACSVPEASISGFVRAELTQLQTHHPNADLSELVAGLMSHVRLGGRTPSPPSSQCQRIARRLASS